MPTENTLNLPTFRYHPDPLRSGSIRAGGEVCRCCRKARGAIYTGPAYGETDLDQAVCPWCIADGSAHARFGVEFIDCEQLPDGVPQAAIETILTRTPGFACWQSVDWPACCGDLMAFIEPAGIDEIRARHRTLEGELMGVIVHELGISGGAAVRYLNSLHRDRGPTAYVFACLSCDTIRARIDSP